MCKTHWANVSYVMAHLIELIGNGVQIIAKIVLVCYLCVCVRDKMCQMFSASPRRENQLSAEEFNEPSPTSNGGRVVMPV